MARNRPRSMSFPQFEKPESADHSQRPAWPKNIQSTLALLDQGRTQQLFNRTYEKAIYTSRKYALSDNTLGFYPPIVLCEPCRAFAQDPPPFFRNKDFGSEAPLQHWKSHHSSLSQLIDCCYGGSHDGQTCALCNLLWQGLRRQLFQRRCEPVTLRQLGVVYNGDGDEVLPHCFDALKMCRECSDDEGLPWQVLRDYGVGPARLTVNVRFRKAVSADVSETELVSLHGEWSPSSGDNNLIWDYRTWKTAEKSPEDATKWLNDPSCLPDSTSSESTFSQIREWMTKCEHHLDCQNRHWRPDYYTRGFEPTRLIDITQNSTQIRLVDGSSTPTRQPLMDYVALSYRWGPSRAGSEPAIMLTSATEESLRNGISLTKLPRTIQDACEIAQRLGFQRIWVDRLCILQDSHVDWTHEAARMAQVYKHAKLVVAASAAPGEDDGCFVDRSRISKGVQSLYLRSAPLFDFCVSGSLVPGGDTGDGSFFQAFHLRLENGKPKFDTYRADKLGHLGDRGWAFQERILPPRIVHFAGEQVFWECRDREANELWPEGVGHNKYGPYLNRPSLWRLKSYAPNLAWHQIVEEYTDRNLTFPRDRLWALAGLARETCEYFRWASGEEVYYAGVWKSTVFEDLMWRRNATKSTMVLEEYIAPSWSWASDSGRVAFARNNLHETERLSSEIKSYMAEVVDMQLLHASMNNIYGAVLDGYLVLDGHVVPMSQAMKSQAIDERYFDERIFFNDHSYGTRSKFNKGQAVDKSGNDVVSYTHFDYDGFGARDTNEEDHQARPSFFLPLYLSISVDDSQAKENVHCVYGLVLARHGAIRYRKRAETLLGPPNGSVGRTRGYQRVGVTCLVFEQHHLPDFKSWLDKYPRGRIIIR